MSSKEKRIKIGDKTYPKEDCHYINGSYYLKGDQNKKGSGQVYFIDDKWYRIETGLLVFDYRQRKYVLRSSLELIVENGIVGFNKKDEPIFGSFSQDLKDPSKVLVHWRGSDYIIIDERLVKRRKSYKLRISNDIYYHKSQLAARKFSIPSPVDMNYKKSLPYNCKGVIKKASKIYNDKYEEKPHYLIDKYGDLIKGLSFGLEYETTLGSIPPREYEPLGLIPLRDGSIGGLEYVTIPLEGKKGLKTIVDGIDVLKKRTRYDKDCSLHIHFGGIERSEEYLVALFKTLSYYQDSFFDAFPIYKKKNYGIKRKHYTKPLPLNILMSLESGKDKKTVKNNFAKIFKFLSISKNYDQYDSDLRNVTSHPHDPSDNSKWNIRTRYYWVNLIPIIFGNKKTVEFRIHTATYDVNKIMYFLFICGSLLKFVEENKNEINKDNNLLTKTPFDLMIHRGLKNSELASRVLHYFDHRETFVGSRLVGNKDLLADEDKFLHRFNPKYDFTKKVVKEEDINKYSKRKLRGIMDTINNIGNSGIIGSDPITTHVTFTSQFTGNDIL